MRSSADFALLFGFSLHQCRQDDSLTRTRATTRQGWMDTTYGARPNAPPGTRRITHRARDVIFAYLAMSKLQFYRGAYFLHAHFPTDYRHAR